LEFAMSVDEERNVVPNVGTRERISKCGEQLVL